MELNERKFTRLVKCAVVGAVSLVFVLAFTLIIQFAVLRNQKHIENDLNATRAALLAELQNGESEKSEMLTDEYIEKYAILFHNRGHKGSVIFN
jgi:hypothetical protein